MFASSLAVAGCGGKSETTSGTGTDAATDGTSNDAEDIGTIAPGYGLPMDSAVFDTAPDVVDSASDAATDGDTRDTGNSAIYGAAPFR